MKDTAKQDEWIDRVLGVRRSSGTGSLGLVSLAKARLNWVAACQRLHAQVETLQSAIVQAYADDPSAGAASKVTELETMVSELDDTLADLLDEVISAAPGQKRAHAQAQAVAVANAYRTLIESDPDISLIDQNEFYPTGIQKIALDALSSVSKELRAAT